jgi:hypothetical protein
MCLCDNIKRRFLAATRGASLPFVVISLSSNPISVCASHMEEYRPSYTWVDELYKLQESSRSYADTIHRFEDNARQLETRMKDSIDLQLNKPIKLPQSYVDNLHRFETKIMRDVENLSKSSISTLPVDFEKNIRTVQIRGIQELDGLIDKPSTSVPSLPTVQNNYALRKGTVPAELYRPSYTWAEELGRDLVRASEIHERMAGNLGQRLYQGFSHLPEDIKPIIKDTIGCIPKKVGTVANTLFVDVPDISRTQDNSLRYLKGAKAFFNVANPFPTSTLEWAAQKDWDIIPPEPYIPTQQDIEEFQDFRPGIMGDVTIQEFRNNELISTQHYENLDFDR